jgi:hypothetical protein
LIYLLIISAYGIDTAHEGIGIARNEKMPESPACASCLCHQVILMSPALSAGMEQVVWVPVRGRSSGVAGEKLPSLFTVVPWMVTPEVAARPDPVMICRVAVRMFWLV